MLGQQNPLFLAIAVVILLVVAYISARQPRKKRMVERQGLSHQELLIIMTQRAQDAVATAKTEYRQELDFSPESVRQVEEILAQLHQRHLEAPFDHAALTQESTKWGAYVGEVIKKSQAREWALDSADAGPWTLPLVERESGAEVFPVSWCRKRIVNGPEDDVWVKFSQLVPGSDQAPPP